MLGLTVSHSVDDLLARALTRVQLSQEQHDRAVARYTKIGEWLADSGGAISKLAPEVFPQGSIRLGTAVKPRDGNEFDIDLVCRLSITSDQATPSAIYDLVYNRLSQHDDFNSRMARKPTCIRLSYADDFHLDIVPACPINGRDLLAIPVAAGEVDGRVALRWKDTNPVGYVTWFERREHQVLKALLERAVQPPPSFRRYKEASPLCCMVQMVKYRRNTYYGTNPAPSSILLTTMLANAYTGEPFSIASMIAVTGRVLEGIKNAARNWTVLNPSLLTEDLAAPLDQGARDRLKDFLASFINEITDLGKRIGLNRIEEGLATLLGQQPAQSAIRVISSDVGARRASGTLTSAGIGGLAAMAPALSHTPHTFFGDHD